MAADLTALVDDLVDESAVLQKILMPLTSGQWRQATPAEGWTIADQVSHLAFFDEATLLSLVDPDRFRTEAEELIAGGMDFPDRLAERYRDLSGAQLLAWFANSRRALAEAYRSADPAARLPWYGPGMGPASSVTARLMETWAHGQDVADALGVVRPATARLRHIAHLGVRSLPYSYRVNGLEVPTQPIRVELKAPDGDSWTWGPEDAVDRVTGAALDFCLVVTQRRHRSDTGLVVRGPVAGQWIGVAQAFAGAAGTGRRPLGEEQ